MAAVGDAGRGSDRAGRRGDVGAGAAGQSHPESVFGELVVAAGLGGGRHRADAQFRRGPADAAGLGRGAGAQAAIRGRLLRRKFAEHHAARRSGARGDFFTSAATTLGRFDVSGVVAAGDVGSAAGGRTGAARAGRRVLPGREEQPVLVAVHVGWLRRIAAAGPGGGVATGVNRGDRLPGAGAVQRVARQAVRCRAGQVARDALPAGICQPDAAATWRPRSVGR